MNKIKLILGALTLLSGSVGNASIIIQDYSSSGTLVRSVDPFGQSFIAEDSLVSFGVSFQESVLSQPSGYSVSE